MNVLLIATGGTIASKPIDGRLVPGISSEELISYVPEIKELCNVNTCEPYKRDSTNMDYGDWFNVAKIIQKNYDLYDAFVVTHGTDTMAYCAAALSYFVQNNSKPIVITGSQKSIYLRDTDARRNLADAFAYACDERSCGCHIVFDGEVILGTRAKKIRSKSYNAFSSVDYPIVAKITEGRVIRFIEEKVSGSPVFCNAINTSVAVIKLIPGQSPDIIEFLAGKCYVLVIEGFGVGGIPSYENGRFDTSLRKIIASGAQVIVTTQVIEEGSDVSVYQVGEISDRLGLIDAKDMTLESIVAKCVWALGVDCADFKKLFLTPIGADIIS